MKGQVNLINQKIQKMLLDLKKDNISGASELIDQVLVIIRTQLDLIEHPTKEIKEVILNLLRKIIESRPSMAPLINTIGFIIHSLEKFTKDTIERRVKEYELERENRTKALELAFGTFLSNTQKKALKIMLISYSSTIINLLLNIERHDFEIFVLESRPLLEGRKVAEILSARFKTHLIIDAAMGKFINQIDLVLIGVDSILKDGAIINKIGTFPLALLANAKNIDVYAVGDSFKYNLRSHYGQEVLIENKPVEEVYDKEIKNKLLAIHNFYFDITPAKYITGIISDLGVLEMQDFLEKVNEQLPTEWFKYLLNNKEI